MKQADYYLIERKICFFYYIKRCVKFARIHYPERIRTVEQENTRKSCLHI